MSSINLIGQKDYLLEGSLESAQNDVGTGLIVYEQQKYYTNW